MSKPLTLWMKVKLFMMYLKEQKDGVIIDCPYCNGTNVFFCDQQTYTIGNTFIYKSRYLCNDCHSACENEQKWVSP